MNYTELMSKPETLLSFMQENLILTAWLKNSTIYGRPQLLKLEKSELFKATRTSSILKKTKNAAVYALKHCGQNDQGFSSYICDYQENEINYQVLDKEADFCFTITMNGCTFGIGSPTSDGSILVTHCNTRTNTENGLLDGDQQNRQRTLALAFHGSNTGLFEPSSYRKNKENATTFGIRSKGEWQFYYQSYSYSGNQKYQIHGVYPIKLTKFSM